MSRLLISSGCFLVALAAIAPCERVPGRGHPLSRALLPSPRRSAVEFAGFDSVLTCGWHSDCTDGVFTGEDAADPSGLDWDDLYGSFSQFRYRAYLYGTSLTGFVEVGDWSARDTTPPESVCRAVQVTMTRRGDNWVLARQQNWHTTTAGAQTLSAPLVASSAGAQSAYNIGTVSASDPYCFITGTHTHQHLIGGAPGATESGHYRNPEIQNEPYSEPNFPNSGQAWQWRWRHP